MFSLLGSSELTRIWTQEPILNIQHLTCECFISVEVQGEGNKTNRVQTFNEITSAAKYQETLKIISQVSFYPQTCFLHWIYWSLLGAVAFPACSAPLRHWKIALSSLCSRAIKAAALLSQNQTPCCSDSASLRLISPSVSFHLLTHKATKSACGREWAFDWTIQFSLFKTKKKEWIACLYVELHLKNNAFQKYRFPQT